MADDKQTQFRAKTEQQKSIFPFRMFIVIEFNCMVVKENGLRFFECDAMLPKVFSGLVGIPLKAQFFHTYKVSTKYSICKLNVLFTSK